MLPGHRRHNRDMKQPIYSSNSLITRYALTAALLFCVCIAGIVPMQQTSADEQAKTRGAVGDVLTPLAMGNSWVYASEDDEIVAIDRVEGLVLFDGKPWYLLRSYEHEKGKPADTAELVLDNFWIAMIDGVECDTFLEYDEEQDSLAPAEITKYFRYPATLGDTYKPTPETDPSLTVTITAIHEKVTTKAGEFDCVVYKEISTEDPTYSNTTYIAPGIGIIKYIGTEGEESWSSELVSYTLADAK